eukprot:CAMPEP_0169157084 /NCGR_PEP_ID=MMETSP1015-20121227/54387_1 /TAXON_ID=342587 /ORGANISM="Karlodinium micrum, Strain CCMP2283" /LENGTH=161 /DNA_ID=CAMNT_0009227979 /DNA_START=150 /DNA_END=635 /DNA_ORIENTATION=+
MTLKESPNRLKRCATPWQMDLELSVSDATWGLERISERPLSRSSSCSSLTHSQTFGASICRSPAPSLNSTDSGGADSLDSFLEEAITTHGSPSRSRKDHMHLCNSWFAESLTQRSYASLAVGARKPKQIRAAIAILCRLSAPTQQGLSPGLAQCNSMGRSL